MFQSTSANNSSFQIDKASLNDRGWAQFLFPITNESDVRAKLIGLSNTLGDATPTRAGGGLCDVLIPTCATAARPKSLSKVYSVGEFPLHNDTAHWLTPCRYIVLMCIEPGNGNRPTLLLDTKFLPLNRSQKSLLHATPFCLTNGRQSFFSTILSGSRDFVRFDPGCMTPTTTDGMKAMAVLSKDVWQSKIEFFEWKRGTGLVLDNWRILHGRGRSNSADTDRKLLRISVK